MLKATRPRSWPHTALARLVCIAALSALLQGCAGSDWQRPTVIAASAMGAKTIYPPAAERDVLPAPPPGLANTPPPAGQPAGRDGAYAGTADPFVTDGGLCGQTLRIEGFQVVGDRVRFDRFHGRIDREDGLQMAYGNEWLIGQFYGATFHGQLMTYAVHGRPACSFIISLERVGG